MGGLPLLVYQRFIPRQQLNSTALRQLLPVVLLYFIDYDDDHVHRGGALPWRVYQFNLELIEQEATYPIRSTSLPVELAVAINQDQIILREVDGD